jgi:hypothetical protein
MNMLPDYHGRRDLGPAHVRAIIDAMRARHEAHILDWEDHQMELAAEEDERLADEAREAEQAEAYLREPFDLDWPKA